ncbi:hypothetical protein [Paenibacillus wenxiniae]|uniref:HNH endonuclease n=1 Tax=Paenibacillus wenxiniae TaxID=1636843 RepID=A0ABW4RG66_9BACL
MKLAIELVPIPTMNVNVRSHISSYRWRQLSLNIQRRDDYACVICERRKGHEVHKLHCHEQWEFNEKHEIQRLIGLQSLCFQCHMLKHIGFADMQGWIEQYALIEHFCEVNRVDREQFAIHLHEAVQQWMHRNRINWKVDLSAYTEWI